MCLFYKIEIKKGMILLIIPILWSRRLLRFIYWNYVLTTNNEALEPILIEFVIFVIMLFL